MAAPVIWLDADDNVATSLGDLTSGLRVEVAVGDVRLDVEVAEAIPFGHKLAVRPIAAGADILKYGEVIGRATTAIPAGRHVHVHNVRSLRGGVEA